MSKSTLDKISSLFSNFKERMQAPGQWEDADIAYTYAQQGKVIDPKTMQVSATFDPNTEEGIAIIQDAKERLDAADQTMEAIYAPEQSLDALEH